MSITMNKELLIRMPVSLYEQAARLCKARYKSLSAFIRDLITEQIENSLTSDEERIVRLGERQYHKNKGVNWRKVKRG